MPRKLVMVSGLFLIGIGAAVLLAEGPGADIVGSLFTVVGTVVAYLQLFIPLPFASQRNIPSSHSTPAEPCSPSAAPGPPTMSPPPSEPVYPSMRHGVLLCAGGAAGILGHLGSLQAITDAATFQSVMTCFMVAGACKVFGLRGVYAMTYERGRMMAAAATASLAAASALSFFSAFASFVAVDHRVAVPREIVSLNVIDQAAFSLGSLLLALVIARTPDAFDRWTIWVSLAFALSSALVVWNAGFLVLVLLRLTGIAHSAAVIHIGWRVTQAARV